MLDRVWRKGNPLTVLVGMQTSTATMENSVEIPLKTGNRTALSGPIISWQKYGEIVETESDFILGAPKSLQMVTAAMKLKEAYSLEEKL